MIDQVAQQGKEIGQTLDLVDDDEARQLFQCQLRMLQAGNVPGILQIEIGIGLERPAESRLTALPGAENGRDGKQRHQLRQVGPIRFSVDQFHGGSIEYLPYRSRFLEPHVEQGKCVTVSVTKVWTAP